MCYLCSGKSLAPFQRLHNHQAWEKSPSWRYETNYLKVFQESLPPGGRPDQNLGRKAGSHHQKQGETHLISATVPLSDNLYSNVKAVRWTYSPTVFHRALLVFKVWVHFSNIKFSTLRYPSTWPAAYHTTNLQRPPGENSDIQTALVSTNINFSRRSSQSKLNLR